MIRHGFRDPSAAPRAGVTSQHPPLRLKALELDHEAAAPAPAVGQPLIGASDPRWVLALRTAESLQGSVLPPDRRENLIRLGKVMGLSAFDSNLVIAIVQDQARRGYGADYCPTAAAAQLSMVPLPRSHQPRRLRLPRSRQAWLHSAILLTVLVTEALLVMWLLT